MIFILQYTLHKAVQFFHLISLYVSYFVINAIFQVIQIIKIWHMSAEDLKYTVVESHYLMKAVVVVLTSYCD